MANRESRLVVKDNSLIDASFNLTLIEQRLMLLAIVEARELDRLSPDIPVEVRAVDYRDQYKTDESEAYKQLAEASKLLFNRQFTYLDRYKDTEAISVARWVNKITYVHDNGCVVMYMSSEVISMISRLEDQFTRYMLEQVSDFKSKYSIRLYELVIKYLSVGNSEKYALSDLRGKLGLKPTEYKTMSLFKTNVLERAIAEINKNTDITIKYNQFKKGRAISHIMFKIAKKQPKTTRSSRDKNTIDMFTGMSIKQAAMFGDKLSRLGSFQSHFKADVGESVEDYAERISIKLTDQFYVFEWMQYLEQVGFVPSIKKES